MIFDQDTQPLATIWTRRPTFRQFRQRYNVSIHDIADQAQVHVLFVYLMDCNRHVEFSIAVCILAALSHYARYTVRFDDIQGIHLKNSELSVALAAR
jgi:hypothetical protein